MNKKPETFLSGILDLYEDISERNTFGAKLNDKGLDLIYEKIPFSEMTCRQKDLEFAEASDFSISRKVKIQYCNILKRNKQYNVVIDNGLYHVGAFDTTPTTTYLYLEYVREFKEE